MRANSKQTVNSRQEENKFSSVSHSERVDSYVYLFDVYTSTELELANIYVSFQNSGKRIYASNYSLAVLLGVTPRTIQRAKATLIRDGLITSEQKSPYATCDIWVSPFFLNTMIRKSLAYFLPALKWIPLAALLSTPKVSHCAPIKTVHRSNVTLLKEKDIYKENYISSYVTNVQKKDCSMSGILARVCDKLSKGQEPEKKSSSPGKYRVMLEPEVFKISEIPLTKWGQIRFCAFPAHIISQARLTYDKTLTGQAAFNSMFAQALTHCRKSNIQPDWKRVQYLATFFKQPDNARMVLNAPIHKDPYEDNTHVRRDERQPPRTHKWKDKKEDPHADSHKREAYKPWQAQEENKRASEMIYIAYFTVEDGYKKSGNPLGFPNPYKQRYDKYLAEALENTTVSKETMEAELYDMYLKSKGKKKE